LKKGNLRPVARKACMLADGVCFTVLRQDESSF